MYPAPNLLNSEMKELENGLLLVENILDKQIVDLNGRKLVRVNDVRLVTLPAGTFAIAVDIGIEGLLRRIGIAIPIKTIFKSVQDRHTCQIYFMGRCSGY